MAACTISLWAWDLRFDLMPNDFDSSTLRNPDIMLATTLAHIVLCLSALVAAQGRPELSPDKCGFYGMGKTVICDQAGKL